jgi:hypothetical protein
MSGCGGASLAPAFVFGAVASCLTARTKPENVMKNLLIACLMGALTAAIPATADAHWHHPHHAWHHGWHTGVSYYPDYGYFNDDPSGPICAWNRNSDGYWHRDCF